MGAVFGEGPLRQWVNNYGWRSVSIFLAIVGFVLALTIALAVRNSPPSMIAFDEKMKKKPTHFWKNLSVVCRNPYTWVVAISGLFLYALTPGFGGLWGISFVHSTYGYSIERSGYAVSMIFIGWAIGAPLIGRISDRLKQKKKLIIAGSFAGALLMSIVIFVPNLPISVLYLLFISLGIISATQLLTYSYAIDINPEETKGTATAFINFMAVAGAAAIQPLIGYFLDRYWTGQMTGNIRVYPAADFRTAMICFPIFFLLSAIFAMFLKKSKELKVS